MQFITWNEARTLLFSQRLTELMCAACGIEIEGLVAFSNGHSVWLCEYVGETEEDGFEVYQEGLLSSDGQVTVF